MNIAKLDGLFAAVHLAQHIRSTAPGQRDGQIHINLRLTSYPESLRGCNAIRKTIAERPNASIILGLQCAGNFRAQGPDEI
jgi:hypothetical protein